MIGVRKWAQVKVDVSPFQTVRAVMISLSDLQYSLLIAPFLQRSKRGYDFAPPAIWITPPLAWYERQI
jgi:hypothetical protein